MRSHYITEILNSVYSKGQTAEMTVFTLYLLHTFLSHSVKLSTFGLASKARTILHYSHLSTKHKHESHVCKFALNAVLNFSFRYISKYPKTRF